MPKANLAILISGRGSNLGALIDACELQDFPAAIKMVISNKPSANGLARANLAGIRTKIVDQKSFDKSDEGRAAFDAAIDEILNVENIDYICLAGFMRILTRDFVTKWRGKLINIHPSLLPAFKGLGVHDRMIDAGVKIAGCTVHFVSTEMDSGPIIGQAAVPVLPDDDADSLAARILMQEHKLYPSCIKLLAGGKARLTTGNKVVLTLNEECPEHALSVPDVSDL